jgi:hypothetical protein
MRFPTRVFSNLLPVLVLVLSMAVTACRREDPRVRNLSEGISKDSAIAVMGGPSMDAPESYLVSGQYIEAMLYRREGMGGPRDSLRRNDLTPVIVINGSLAGWGWKFWDSVAGAHGIPTRLR